MANIIVDIVIVVILLSFFIIGAKKGFTKTLLSLVSGIVLLIVCFVFTKSFTNVMYGTGIDEKIMDSVEASVNKVSPNGQTSFLIWGDHDDDEETAKILQIRLFTGEVQPLNEYLNASPIRTVFDFLSEPIEKNVRNEDGTVSINQAISSVATNIIMTVISFLILFVILKIVVVLLTIILKKFISKITILRWVDTGLGAILNVIIGCVVVSLLMALLNLLSGVGFLEQTMKAIEGSYLAKFFNNFNLFTKIFALIIK